MKLKLLHFKLLVSCQKHRHIIRSKIPLRLKLPHFLLAMFCVTRNPSCNSNIILNNLNRRDVLLFVSWISASLQGENNFKFYFIFLIYFSFRLVGQLMLMTTGRVLWSSDLTSCSSYVLPLAGGSGSQTRHPGIDQWRQKRVISPR